MTRKEIVGENIRNLRNARGMSQTDFAQAIKRRQSTVAMYENGDRLPPAPIITLIANIFGVSFDDVYYTEEERKNGKHAHSSVTFDITKANIPVPRFQTMISDQLLESVLSEEDDQLLRELEAIRRDPERQRLFKRASHSDIDEVRQANAILDALKETKR